MALIVGVLVWRAPDLEPVKDAFTTVEWSWVAVAFLANLLSTWLRAAAWQVTLEQALPRPYPSHRNVFSAFSVGLIANVALPGRVGEFARVGVLSRRISDGASRWPSVAGSILAHRVLDVVPTAGLAAYVLIVVRLPAWADTGVYVVVAVGGAMFAAAVLLATRRQSTAIEGKGRAAELFHMARRGLAVFRRPSAVMVASVLQLVAWGVQLLAVWLALRAFGINEPIAAAALVLLVVNVALAFPLWPSAVGLYQAGVALALLPYGISYQHGFAAGIGIQAIEISVGAGLGLIFLAREGLSFATLRAMPKASDRSVRDRAGTAALDDSETPAAGEPTEEAPARRSLQPVYSSVCRRRRTARVLQSADGRQA
jgi:uncharacterized protein (TIRG00374 family)